MTRPDMEGTNARRTAHEMNRILENALNTLWDASGEQIRTTALLTNIVRDNPNLIQPLMSMLEHASSAQSTMIDAQRQLRVLKDAVHEWEQGDSGALMDLLGVERANEPQRSKKKTPPDVTETVEAPAIKS